MANASQGRGQDDDLEWVGVKFQLAESCDDDLPRLVTDVHTTPAIDRTSRPPARSRPNSPPAPGRWPST